MAPFRVDPFLDELQLLRALGGVGVAVVSDRECLQLLEQLIFHLTGVGFIGEDVQGPGFWAMKITAHMCGGFHSHE